MPGFVKLDTSRQLIEFKSAEDTSLENGRYYFVGTTAASIYRIDMEPDADSFANAPNVTEILSSAFFKSAVQDCLPRRKDRDRQGDFGVSVLCPVVW